MALICRTWRSRVLCSYLKTDRIDLFYQYGVDPNVAHVLCAYNINEQEYI